MLSFSTAKTKNTRLGSIDGLRGVAVLLVLLRHFNINDYVSDLGWMGVDLFFVISGFLISGLLFKELDKHGKIDFPRFFMRRGLKIYPLFFCLVLATFLTTLFFTPHVSPRPFLHELLFLQNYLGGVYVHTWSLAVEEHFYLALMFCFAVFFVRNHLHVVPVCLFFIALPLLLRVWNCLQGDYQNHFFTHTRIDTLFTGVLLCYGWRYHQEKLLALRKEGAYILPLTCLAFLLAFGFIGPRGFITQGPGFTVIAFCFAGILLFSLDRQTKKDLYGVPLSLVGFYSYSIYLVHIPVKMVLESIGILETEGIENLIYFLIYLVSCVVTGIGLSELVEQPLLRLRDKKIPSRA